MKALAAACLAAAACGAWAHDTWFAPSRDPARGATKLELATGTRYPVQDSTPGAASVVRAECRGRGGQRVPLQGEDRSTLWLDLTARGDAVSCWAELMPFSIQLEPKIVQVYLDEIHASPAVRQAWARMQARGVPWRESYRKFARIELDPSLAARREPAGLPMELVVLGEGELRAGAQLAFQLLRDGKPLASFPVEFVSERSRVGLWRETDAEGKLRQALPFAGRWLLRGTDVRPAADGERWESRFVTLAIELR